MSRSKGQVGHVLLTRSPLHVRPRAVSSFDLHVLGTPPAFILSQDQTLRLRGGNRFPLSPILVSALARPPSRGCALGPGFRSQESFAWLVLLSLLSIRFSRFCGAPPGAPSLSVPPEAQGDILRARHPAVKNYFPVSREFFPRAFHAAERRQVPLSRRCRDRPVFAGAANACIY